MMTEIQEKNAFAQALLERAVAKNCSIKIDWENGLLMINENNTPDDVIVTDLEVLFAEHQRAKGKISQ